MRVRIIFLLSLIFLLTSCSGLMDPKPTSTPDPLEITIREFEDLRDRVNELVLVAADTPVEDLESIVPQMTALTDEIESYEFPLEAAQVHSALYNFAWFSEQCYFGIYAEYLLGETDQEPMRDHGDPCDQAGVYEETYNFYLQEVQERYAER